MIQKGETTAKDAQRRDDAPAMKALQRASEINISGSADDWLRREAKALGGDYSYIRSLELGRVIAAEHQQSGAMLKMEMVDLARSVY